MHVEFLARGRGSARTAADYLLGERDSAGQLRAGVEVVRGDPAIKLLLLCHFQVLGVHIPPQTVSGA